MSHPCTIARAEVSALKQIAASGRCTQTTSDPLSHTLMAFPDPSLNMRGRFAPSPALVESICIPARSGEVKAELVESALAVQKRMEGHR